MANSAKTAEYGDFQTPPALAQCVCALIERLGVRPSALIEPTCGLGQFLFAGLDRFSQVETAVGVEINQRYVEVAEKVRARRSDSATVRLWTADFFQTDWASVVAGLPEPILILGNLPWVTSSHLGAIGSENLPKKSNFQKHKGLDAVTGKSNFDVSEWMLIRLVEIMQARQGMLAMLCKSAVARKLLAHAWKHNWQIGRPAIYGIDAARHFDAAVDAVLLVVPFAQSERREASVYSSLNVSVPETVMGFEDDVLLANVAAYHAWKHLGGREIIKWRSGVKHDCSKVMEFVREGEKFRNGLGELAAIEDAYLFPMLKSSHLANDNVAASNRWMLVTQQAIGEDTSRIQDTAPRTWQYLLDHSPWLNKRGSSIYRDRPQFSIFGVGDYTFAPWKVAISGFYKRLDFVVVGPERGKPTVLDDTAYFLPCESKEQAEFLATVLNSRPAREFYQAFIFWDSKRPITAALLKRLDLSRLSESLGLKTKFDALFGASKQKEQEVLLWQD